MMQAAVLDSPGAEFRVAPVPRPHPEPGHVLVRVEASAVNPLDINIRAGQAAHARQPLPAVLGIDLAGVVEAVGSGVNSEPPAMLLRAAGYRPSAADIWLRWVQAMARRIMPMTIV